MWASSDEVTVTLTRVFWWLVVANSTKSSLKSNNPSSQNRWHLQRKWHKFKKDTLEIRQPVVANSTIICRKTNTPLSPNRRHKPEFLQRKWPTFNKEQSEVRPQRCRKFDNLVVKDVGILASYAVEKSMGFGRSSNIPTTKKMCLSNNQQVYVEFQIWNPSDFGPKFCCGSTLGGLFGCCLMLGSF